MQEAYMGLQDQGTQRMAFSRNQKGHVLDKQAAARLVEVGYSKNIRRLTLPSNTQETGVQVFN